MINTSFSLEKINNLSKNTIAKTLSIEFTGINPEFLQATMPVNKNTHQPLGLLHGGASAVLSETVGSMASYLSLDTEQYYCLGLELKINHIKAVSQGKVTATATPIHLGSKTHVWQIRNEDENGDLASFAILTMAILPLNPVMKEIIGNLMAGL